MSSTDHGSLWASNFGLLQVPLSAGQLDGDVVLVDPAARRIERLLRAGSSHNTLLVTERCDQLCIMCSQPPKKTHDDRFDLLAQAIELAEPGLTIGISGGEPTLYKAELFSLLNEALISRPDLRFHVLSNGQHFTASDIPLLREKPFKSVVWGIPLYAPDAAAHDAIVAKRGAFERLHESFEYLLLSATRVELRTVLLNQNIEQLADLAQHIRRLLPFIEQWSVMGLENIGFARNRWNSLYLDPRKFERQLSLAFDYAALFGIQAKLFNLPLCHLNPHLRQFAVASISDWKQKFAQACSTCSQKKMCSGFFEWHPENLLNEVIPI